MQHTWKNAPQVRKCGTLGKMRHILEKCDALGKMSHT